MLHELFFPWIPFFLFFSLQIKRLAEQMNLMKRERDLRDEALTRLSLELETCQRSEAALKNQIRLKTTLIESNRQEMQRQLSKSSHVGQ